MLPCAKIAHSADLARFDELPLTNVPLFEEETFSGCLLGFLPGQVLPRHCHEHEHEVFDVVSGMGTLWLDGQPHQAGPGTSVFVPARVEHGFETPGPTAGSCGPQSISERTCGRR
jgi:quercetin dioxygenase-like cupin family protein